MTRSLHALGALGALFALVLVTGCGKDEAQDSEGSNEIEIPALTGSPTDDDPLVSDPGATGNMLNSCGSAVVDPLAYVRSVKRAMSTRLARGARPRIEGLAPNNYGAACSEAIPVALGTLNYDTYTQGNYGAQDVWSFILQILSSMQQKQWWGGGWNGGGWGGGYSGGGNWGGGACGVQLYNDYSYGGGYGGDGIPNDYRCNDWTYRSPFAYGGGQVSQRYGYGWY